MKNKNLIIKALFGAMFIGNMFGGNGFYDNPLSYIDYDENSQTHTYEINLSGESLSRLSIDEIHGLITGVDPTIIREINEKITEETEIAKRIAKINLAKFIDSYKPSFEKKIPQYKTQIHNIISQTMQLMQSDFRNSFPSESEEVLTTHLKNLNNHFTNFENEIYEIFNKILNIFEEIKNEYTKKNKTEDIIDSYFERTFKGLVKNNTVLKYSLTHCYYIEYLFGDNKGILYDLEQILGEDTIVYQENGKNFTMRRYFSQNLHPMSDQIKKIFKDIRDSFIKEYNLFPILNDALQLLKNILQNIENFYKEQIQSDSNLYN